MNTETKRAARRHRICEIVRQNGYVTVAELAAEFQVTPQTIRRDIHELDAEIKVEKVHGGVRALESDSTEDLNGLNHKKEDQLTKGLTAVTANLVPNGASLFLNAGNMSECVARAFLEHERLHVVTNNVKAAAILTQNLTFQVICAGGEISNENGGIVHTETFNFLNQYRLDMAIININSIEEDGTLLGNNIFETKIIQVIIQNSRSVISIIKKAEFGDRPTNHIGHIRELDNVVMEEYLAASYEGLCSANNVQLTSVPA